MIKYPPSYNKKNIPKRYLKDLNTSEKKKMVKEITKRPDSLKFWSADKEYSKRLKSEKRTIKHSKYYLDYIKKYGKENTGSLEKISKATGINIKILKEVRKRGIGAWTSGHRPGVKPNQWAMARVYSFVMGGKTTLKADKDLYDKVKKNYRKT